MKRRILVGWVVGLLLAWPLGAAAQQEQQLSWQWTPGERLAVDFHQSYQARTELRGRPTTVDVDLTMRMHWRVDQVDPEGRARVRQTIEHMTVNVVTPATEPVHYDSAAERQPPGPARRLDELLRPMLGAPLHVILDARGTVHDVQLGDQMRRAAQQLGELEAMLSPESIEQMLRQSTATLPEQPVRVGDRWQRTLELPTPLGRWKQRDVFTYDGPQAEAERLHDIRVEAEVEVEPGVETLAPEAAEPAEVTVTQSGRLLFDVEAGRAERVQMVQRIETRTPYRDLLIHVRSDSQLEIRFSPIRQED